MAILEVKNIKKGFGSTDVLKGVSFSLEKGQVLAIIGSSGSGKTTLLRCLNFLETPDEGEIFVDGQLLNGGQLTDEQIRQNRLHFGLVFQNFNLFPQYTVLENITLAPKLLKKGMIWPLFYTGAFYLIFNGLLTVLFSKLEEKLNYFRG